MSGGRLWRPRVWLWVPLGLAIVLAPLSASRAADPEEASSATTAAPADSTATASSAADAAQAQAQPAKKKTEKPRVVTALMASAASEFQSAPGVSAPMQRDPQAGQLYMEFRYSINHTDIKGNVDNSFLTQGVNNLGEVTTLYKAPVWGVRKMEAMGLYRYTDDPRVDPEVNSLQRGYLRLTGPTFESTFGDVLASYSRFSFNQNVKGVNAWKRLPVGSGLKLTGTAGMFQDRWGSLFKGYENFVLPGQTPDPQFPPKPYNRLELGGRAEQSWNENSFVAINYSQGRDRIDSLPPEVVSPRPIYNQVVSVDTTAVPVRDLTVRAELALSYTQFDARYQHQKRRDYAARLEATHRWRKLSWSVNYARFLPNFFSINARQVQDLQDTSARVDYDFTDNITAEASYRYTNDDLPGSAELALNTNSSVVEALTNPTRTVNAAGLSPFQQSRFDAACGPLAPGETLYTCPYIVDANGNKMTTFVRNPEVRVMFRRLPPDRNLEIRVGYRERDFETSNRGSYVLDATGVIVPDPVTGDPQPLFTDRKTRMPFVDLTWSTRSSIFDFSYEYRQERDRAIPTNSTFTNHFGAGYRGTYFWGDWVVSPSFRFETEPLGRLVPLSPPLVDPFFPAGYLAITGRDQTRTISSTVTVDFPKYFSLETVYRELNAELFTPYTVTDPVTFDTTRLFGNGGYDRPYFRAALTYKIRNSEDHYAVVSFERAVNTFLQPDPTAADTRSFRENVIQFGYVFRFRR